MSFSGDVKIELSKINNMKNKKEVYCEFLGYLSTFNTSIENNKYKFSTSNEYNINRFSKLLNNIGISNYDIFMQGNRYVITFRSVETISTQLINESLTTESLIKSYIRGAFLGGGSINNPESNYHLEIIYSDLGFAKILVDNLLRYNIPAKIIKNNKNIMIYLKDGQEISNFLALIGANSSVIKFEEMRVIRDMKNQVNRIVNCETANLNKTIDASVEQLGYIKKLKKSGRFDSLPDNLKEIARLREKKPDATLEELGKLLESPIGKSSVNYRFKKIKEIAEEEI